MLHTLDPSGLITCTWWLFQKSTYNRYKLLVPWCSAQEMCLWYSLYNEMLIINFLLCFWSKEMLYDILYSLAASFGSPWYLLPPPPRADTVDTNKDMTTNTVKKAEAALGDIRRFPIVSFLKFCIYLSSRTFSSEQFHISIWVKMEKT